MRWTLILAFFALLPGRLHAAQPWDSSRYMLVSEVKIGMVGYGLTVFRGTKIEKFNVEVVDVLKNLINPKCDVVLIYCKDPNLEHSGPVEGMSGSPIYLYNLDDTQHLHPRLIGAFAYGWQWAKDPLAGVQPIQYMLSIPKASPETETVENTSGHIAAPRWSLADVPALPGFDHNAAGFAVRSTTNSFSAGRLRPLATPLMASGVPPSVAAKLAPMFASVGLDLLDGGGSGTSASPDEDIKMEPGAVLVAPLLTGDIELSASGTCTEVIGDRVLAFGHEFNNEGSIRLPMSTGRVATIVANLQSSFKLAETGKLCGTLTNDQTVGVAGTLGAPPAMIPIELRVKYDDGSMDQTFHFSAVLHDKFTPLAAAAALQTAIAGVKDIPDFHTLDYDLNLDFAGGRSVRIANSDANQETTELAQSLALPIQAAIGNPFRKVALQRISGTINVSSDVRLAEITAVTLPKLKFEPGVRVKAYVNYRPWRGGEQTLPIEFDLPRDLPDGDYQLVVSDWQRFFTDQRQAEPFRFTAETIGDLFAVVQDFESIRHDAIYVRLLRQADGVAVGRTALPLLPASVRQAMLEGQRSDLTPYISSAVQSVPTDRVMSGAAEFTLTIERQVHVESARSPKPTTQPD